MRSRWFPALVIACIAFLGVAAYTGITGGATGLVSGLRSLAVPAQRAVTHTAVGIADTYNKYFNYDDLVAERDSLKKQVDELQQQLLKSEDAVSENESLREMLSLRKNSDEDFTYETAEVIAREMDDWSTTLTIDVGANGGIEVNDCVVTAGGLVGYVSDVQPYSATVTAMTDTETHVAAMISRIRELGVAEGDYQLMSDGKLRISYLPREADIVIGDQVITSGTGGIFPKGLIIGSVESVKTESDGMSSYAVLQPAVSLTDVRQVFIIVDGAHPEEEDGNE